MSNLFASICQTLLRSIGPPDRHKYAGGDFSLSPFLVLTPTLCCQDACPYLLTIYVVS